MEDKKENIYKENNLLLVPVKEKSLAKKVTDRVPTTLDTLKHYAKLVHNKLYCSRRREGYKSICKRY